MTEEVKPASDEEITGNVEGMYDPNGHCVFCWECVADTGAGIPYAGEPHDKDCATRQPMFMRFIARIESDRAALASERALRRELQEALRSENAECVCGGTGRVCGPGGFTDLVECQRAGCKSARAALSRVAEHDAEVEK